MGLNEHRTTLPSHGYRHSGERHLRDSSYLERIHPNPGPVLQDIEAEAEHEGQPITERPSTRLLATVVQAIAARRALEVGTNIGYSAIAIASAMATGSELITLDIDPEMHARARANAERAGVSNRIRMVTGAALDTLPGIEGPFDFAYIDANKDTYPQYLDAVLARLRPGGVVAIDNLLWLGQAAHEPEDSDFARDSTPVIRTFNKAFLADARLDATIVQVGDGIGLGVKRSD